MKVELRFYTVNPDGSDTEVGVAGEVETTIPEAPAAATDGYSIIAADQIELNIYVAKTDDITSLDVTSNTKPDEETHSITTKNIAGGDLAAIAKVVDGASYYVVNVPLAPAQIWDKLEVKVNTNTGSRTITKSVAQYCYDILQGAYTGDKANEVINLARAILDYGKACYDYFGYTSAEYDGYTIVNPTCNFADSYAYSGIPAGTVVSYVATTVPELRFEIQGVDETAAIEANKNLTSSIGEAAFKKEPDGKIVLCITGIKADDLGETITVSGSYNFTFTPLAWAKAAAADAGLSALGNAIGNYAAAAAAYFG